MRIAEIFYSIQGEGMLAGTPSVFIRTTGCNLRCVWCDTPYTSWSPEGEERSVDSVLEQVRSNAPRASYAVVTGGEPMIAPEIELLTRRLKELGLHITIETAGTVYKPVTCDLMSISPKLANSTPHEREGGRWAEQHERLRIQPDVLRRLISEYAYQLKFVVERREDRDAIRALAAEIGAGRDRVVLMPEGTDSRTLAERSRWIVELCKQEGFRFSPRLHIDLWGNHRGV